MNRWFWGLAMLGIAACGADTSDRITGEGNNIPESDIVVRSRAEVQMGAGGGLFSRGVSKSGDITISVINSKFTAMSLDTSEWINALANGDMASFGYLSIGDLRDNDLKVCGAGGNQKCGTALIRMYTTGTAGPGIYNADEGYGAPLIATLSAPFSIGLEKVQAVIMQTLAVPASMRVIHKSDFSPEPRYGFQGDFTNAGAGSFGTKLIIEYALAP